MLRRKMSNTSVNTMWFRLVSRKKSKITLRSKHLLSVIIRYVHRNDAGFRKRSSRSRLPNDQELMVTRDNLVPGDHTSASDPRGEVDDMDILFGLDGYSVRGQFPKDKSIVWSHGQTNGLSTTRRWQLDLPNVFDYLIGWTSPSRSLDHDCT